MASSIHPVQLIQFYQGSLASSIQSNPIHHTTPHSPPSHHGVHSNSPPQYTTCLACGSRGPGESATSAIVSNDYAMDRIESKSRVEASRQCWRWRAVRALCGCGALTKSFWVWCARDNDPSYLVICRDFPGR